MFPVAHSLRLFDDAHRQLKFKLPVGERRVAVVSDQKTPQTPMLERQPTVSSPVAMSEDCTCVMNPSIEHSDSLLLLCS
jgi:hypothetical protein